MFTSSLSEWFPTKLRHHACGAAGFVVVIKDKSGIFAVSFLTYLCFLGEMGPKL